MKKRGILLTVMLIVAGFSSVLNIINFLHPLYSGEIYIKNFPYLNFLNFLTVVLFGTIGVVGAFYWKKWAAALAVLGPLSWQIIQIIYLPMFLAPINYILTLIFDVLFIWSFARKWPLFT
jgi:hypothetical protein